MLYCAFLFFIAGGSPHLVLEHFLGLVGWNFWKKKNSAVLSGVVSLTVLLLLIAVLFIWIREYTLSI